MTECITGTTGRDALGLAAPVITSFLLKVASRCNLACDYCYMYAHADQSWRHQPKFMSDEVIQLAAKRVAEHAAEHALERVAIIIHGGEPLLAGAERLAYVAETFRDAMRAVAVDFGLQTNGTLLDETALDVLEQAGIGVSLSLDGTREASDRHRRSHGGRSSHEATMAALRLLAARPHTFSGVIAVIDPANDPKELLDFFARTGAPQLDLLLPDANHLNLPPGRDDKPDLYEAWLLNAFDVWFDQHPDLPIRTFEAILDTVAGLPSPTDAFGFGDVSLLTIETDGTYHDLDVLKTAAEGSSALGLHVATSSVDDAAATDKIGAHRLLLRAEGLSPTCRACDVVDACGGGAVPHRYAADGFAHPTVYCREIQGLIRHARGRVRETLEDQIATEQAERAKPRAAVDLARFDVAETSAEVVGELRYRWSLEAEQGLIQAAAQAVNLSNEESAVAGAVAQLHALPADNRRELAVQPAVTVWAHVLQEAAEGRRTLDLAGRPMEPVPGDLVGIVERADELARPVMRWHASDPWLRRPFADARVVFEDELAHAASDLGRRAFALIVEWRPQLAQEISLLSRDVLFVRDLSAHPDKIVSFSDDSAPGALYCSVRRGDGLISPLDLADSLIHEHRHQKLYLLDRYVPVVLRDRPLVSSPWREDMRPPSGLLHAVFVFTELIAFWRHIAVLGPDSDRAEREVDSIASKLRAGFETLETVALTDQGLRLLQSLKARARA